MSWFYSAAPLKSSALTRLFCPMLPLVRVDLHPHLLFGTYFLHPFGLVPRSLFICFLLLELLFVVISSWSFPALRRT